MIRFYDDTIISIAEEHDKLISKYIKVIDKFGVCGVEKKSNYESIIYFLKTKKISFETNDRMLIWHPTIKSTLRELFLKK